LLGVWLMYFDGGMGWGGLAVGGGGGDHSRLRKCASWYDPCQCRHTCDCLVCSGGLHHDVGLWWTSVTGVFDCSQAAPPVGVHWWVCVLVLCVYLSPAERRVCYDLTGSHASRRRSSGSHATRPVSAVPRASARVPRWVEAQVCLSFPSPTACSVVVVEAMLSFCSRYRHHVFVCLCMQPCSRLPPVHR
jgi:hypothetical protein